MYIPTLKNRRNEKIAIKNISHLVSENIIPLIEIINISKNKTFIDEVKIISKICDNKAFFVDPFRFDINNYGNNIEAKKCVFSINLNNNENEYITYLKQLNLIENSIPVISIKKGFSIDKRTLKDLINHLQQNKKSIAFRIDDNELDNYLNFIIRFLRNEDYFMFDIGENNIDSKFIEIDELNKANILANKVILTSNRSIKLETADLENNKITPYIDLKLLFSFREYGFVAYGDYAGVKDTMPTRGGGNGTGRAYALLLQINEQGVYSFVNDNTKDGTRGYKNLIPLILANQPKFDKENSCPAFKVIKKMNDENRTGNWGSWIAVCIMRYLHQIYEYEKKSQ